MLNVPHYNWHWQLWYNLAEPIKLPKGTKIECTEHFDNSAEQSGESGPHEDGDLGTAELR